MLSYKGKLINVVARKRLNPQVPNDGHEVMKQKKIENIGKKLSKIIIYPGFMIAIA